MTSDKEVLEYLINKNLNDIESANINLKILKDLEDKEKALSFDEMIKKSIDNLINSNFIKGISEEIARKIIERTKEVIKISIADKYDIYKQCKDEYSIAGDLIINKDWMEFNEFPILYNIQTKISINMTINCFGREIKINY